MKTVMRNPFDLTPYERNTKKHTEKQIDAVASSIREYGFVQPVVIDNDDTIVIGHCRTLAAQKLNLSEVPCVLVDDLTPEQVRALRIVDNKTNESEWDLDFLAEELVDLDLDDFGLHLEEVEDLEFTEELEHEEHAERTQERVENILNLAKGQYEGNNPYDIPELAPVTQIPDVKEWVGFNYVLSDKNPEGKGVHFFIDDYQFERLWDNPERYVDKLRQYECVCTPDFSPYGDMPLICQMWNHYRKHWIGAFLQDAGLTVIPTIRASTDPRSFDWYLDGEPHNGIVCISNMWTSNDETKEYFLKEFGTMKETLTPSGIYVYGKKMDELGDVKYIDTFTRGRFGK